jgi:hypothetical protein
MSSGNRKIESRVNSDAVAPKGRDLSQFSHGLTGQSGTMTYVPDTRHDADLRIRILTHSSDTFH